MPRFRAMQAAARAVLPILVGLGACIPLSTPYEMSAPTPDAAHPRVETESDGSATYTSGPLTLRLEARNRYFHGTGLMLWMVLPVPVPQPNGPEHPDSTLFLALDWKLAGGSATIDPMALLLTRDGLPPLAPLAFRGPVGGDYYWCGYQAGWSTEPGARTIPVGKDGGCLMLVYRTTSAVDSAFALDLAGVMVDGRPAELGTVHFAKFHGHAAQPRDWHPAFPDTAR